MSTRFLASSKEGGAGGGENVVVGRGRRAWPASPAAGHRPAIPFFSPTLHSQARATAMPARLLCRTCCRLTTAAIIRIGTMPVAIPVGYGCFLDPTATPTPTPTRTPLVNTATGHLLLLSCHGGTPYAYALAHVSHVRTSRSGRGGVCLLSERSQKNHMPRTVGSRLNQQVGVVWTRLAS